MNFRRLYLIIFVLSSVGFHAQNCFSAGEEKATSVGQEAKLFGDVAKKFAKAKSAQARRLASKTSTSISNGAGRAWSWFGEKCSWAKAKTASGFENLKKTSTEKGQAAKKWFDKNSPVAKEKAKQSWKKIKSSTSSAKDKTLVSLNAGRKWSSEKAKLFWLLAKKSTEQKMASTRAWTESKYDKSKKTWQALEIGEKCAWIGTFVAVATLLGVGIGSFIKKDKPPAIHVPDPIPDPDPVLDMSLSGGGPRRNEAGDFLVTGEELLNLWARGGSDQGVVLPEDIAGQLRAAWTRSDFMTTEFVLPERLVSSIVQMNPTLLVPEVLVPEGRLPERPAITFGPMPRPAVASAPVGPTHPAIVITPPVAEEVFAALEEGESVFPEGYGLPPIEERVVPREALQQMLPDLFAKGVNSWPIAPPRGVPLNLKAKASLTKKVEEKDVAPTFAEPPVSILKGHPGPAADDNGSIVVDMPSQSFFDDPDYSKKAQETGWEPWIPNISMPSLFSFVPTAITSRLSEFPWFGQKKQDPAAERPVLTATPNLSSSSLSGSVVELKSNSQAPEIPVFVGIEPKILSADAQQEFALIKLRKKTFNVPVFSSNLQVPAGIDNDKLVLIKNASADPCLLRMNRDSEPLVISEGWRDHGHYLDIDIQNTRQRVQVVSEQEFDNFQPSQAGPQLLMRRENADVPSFRLFQVERISDCYTSSAEINLEEWNFAPKHCGFLDFVFVGQEKNDQGTAFVFDRGNFVSLDPAYLEQGRPTFVMLRKPSKNIQGSFDHQLFMVEKGEDGQTQEWTPIEAGKWNFHAELESGSPVSQEDEATELRSENEPTDQSNAAFSELVPVALTDLVDPSESLAAINPETSLVSPEQVALPPSPLSSEAPEIPNPVANHQDSGVEPSSGSQSLPSSTSSEQSSPTSSGIKRISPQTGSVILTAPGYVPRVKSSSRPSTPATTSAQPNSEPQASSRWWEMPSFGRTKKAAAGLFQSIFGGYEVDETSVESQESPREEVSSATVLPPPVILENSSAVPAAPVAEELSPAVVPAESKSDQGNVAAVVEPANEHEISVVLSEGIISVRLPEPISNPLDLIVSENAENQAPIDKQPIEPVALEVISTQKPSGNQPKTVIVRAKKVNQKPASKKAYKSIKKTKAEEFGLPTGENRPQPIPKIGDKSKKPASRSKRNGNPSSNTSSVEPAVDS